MAKSKQPSYRPIYNLSPVRLEILKIYIQTNLPNSFLLPLKSFFDTFIFFVCKFRDSLHLYVHYQDLNNLIIKNWYSQPLIDKFLNWLEWTKYFIYLDFTSTYHWIKIKECNE